MRRRERERERGGGEGERTTDADAAILDPIGSSRHSSAAKGPFAVGDGSPYKAGRRSGEEKSLSLAVWPVVNIRTTASEDDNTIANAKSAKAFVLLHLPFIHGKVVRGHRTQQATAAATHVIWC